MNLFKQLWWYHKTIAALVLAITLYILFKLKASVNGYFRAILIALVATPILILATILLRMS